MAYVAGSAAWAARQATATPTVTLGAAVSVGDIIVVYYGHDTSTSDTVPTDSLGNTYTFQGSPRTDANFNIHRVATARVTTAGTPVITLHLPGTASAGAIFAAAYSGRATTSWVTDFDSAEQATPATSADGITCPALTTTAADDLAYFLVGVQGNTAVFTAGTNFTERLEQGGSPGTDFNVALTDRLNVGGGSITPVGTTSDANRTCSFAISLAAAAGAGTAAVTGTATASITEADIVTGGKTIIVTLTGDTWVVAAGGLFDAQRQNIIDGLDSAQAEGTGWDAVVKTGLAVTTVVRTSDTVVTITLAAFGSYNITATETITVTVPATATALNLSAIVATPTFTVAPVSAGSAVPTMMLLNHGG